MRSGWSLCCSSLASRRLVHFGRGRSQEPESSSAVAFIMTFNPLQRPNLGPAGPNPAPQPRAVDPALYREGPAAKPLVSGFAIAGLVCSIAGLALFGLQVV